MSGAKAACSVRASPSDWRNESDLSDFRELRQGFIPPNHAERALSAKRVEYESAANMKRTWVGYGLPRDWMDREQGEGHEFSLHRTQDGVHEAVQVKNIWVPTGE